MSAEIHHTSSIGRAAIKSSRNARGGRRIFDPLRAIPRPSAQRARGGGKSGLFDGDLPVGEAQPERALRNIRRARNKSPF